MYDNYHEDFAREDAEHVIARGAVCESCVHPDTCKDEGACIRQLDQAEAEEFATGGIVTGPSPAILGENGCDYVVPPSADDEAR